MRSLWRGALWGVAFVAASKVLTVVISFTDKWDASPWLRVPAAIIAGALVFWFFASVGERRLARTTAR